MRYDLNYWPEPDWEREGRLGLLGWAVIWVGICAVLMMVAMGVALKREKSRQTVLSRYEKAESANREVVGELKRQQQCVRFWKKMENELNVRGDKRIGWAGQLGAIQQMIPEAIVLRNLGVQGSMVKVELPAAVTANASKSRVPARRVSEFLMRYELRLRGVSHGEEAEATITALSRDLPQSTVTQELMDTVQLSSVGPDSDHRGEGVPGTEFVIVCGYKPFNWSKDDVKSVKR